MLSRSQETFRHPCPVLQQAVLLFTKAHSSFPTANLDLHKCHNNINNGSVSSNGLQKSCIMQCIMVITPVFSLTNLLIWRSVQWWEWEGLWTGLFIWLRAVYRDGRCGAERQHEKIPLIIYWHVECSAVNSPHCSSLGTYEHHSKANENNYVRSWLCSVTTIETFD